MFSFFLRAAAIVFVLMFPVQAARGMDETRMEESSPPAVSPQSQRVSAMEDEVISRINEIRREHGLNPLEPNPSLNKIAREYSRSMSRKEFFSHQGPAGRQVDDRLREAGLSYRMVGENISMSINVPDPVTSAVEGWMDSPGHRKNILRQGFTQTGVGIWKDGATYHFTQIFFRPR